MTPRRRPVSGLLAVCVIAVAAAVLACALVTGWAHTRAAEMAAAHGQAQRAAHTLISAHQARPGSPPWATLTGWYTVTDGALEGCAGEVAGCLRVEQVDRNPAGTFLHLTYSDPTVGPVGVRALLPTRAAPRLADITIQP